MQVEVEAAPPGSRRCLWIGWIPGGLGGSSHGLFLGGDDRCNLTDYMAQSHSMSDF